MQTNEIQSALRRERVLPLEVVGVRLGEVGPFFGQIVQRENGGDRTDGNAGAAVDAFDWIDIDHFDGREVGLILFGWMQSTGQASTQAASLVPIQGSAI